MKIGHVDDFVFFIPVLDLISQNLHKTRNQLITTFAYPTPKILQHPVKRDLLIPENGDVDLTT